jgi:hypothetical protein
LGGETHAEFMLVRIPQLPVKDDSGNAYPKGHYTRISGNQNAIWNLENRGVIYGLNYVSPGAINSLIDELHPEAMFMLTDQSEDSIEQDGHFSTWVTKKPPFVRPSNAMPGSAISSPVRPPVAIALLTSTMRERLQSMKNVANEKRGASNDSEIFQVGSISASEVDVEGNKMCVEVAHTNL